MDTLASPRAPQGVAALRAACREGKAELLRQFAEGRATAAATTRLLKALARHVDGVLAAAWAEAVALRQRLGGQLVVVTHGLVLRCWLARLPLQLPAGVAAPSAWHNTGLSSLGEGFGHRLRRVNCTAHLAGTLASGQRSLSGG